MKNRFTPLHRALFGAAVLTAASFSAQAQGVGVGTTAPDASAALDIVSTTKGALLPRVASTGSVASPATGLIVFQTGSPAGFYYNSGTTTAPVWQQIATAAGTSTGFVQNQNAADQVANFRINGTGSALGRLGAGTSAPQLGLDAAAGSNIGLRNNAAWDHLYWFHDGSTGFMRAGGAETGLALQVGASATGTYGDASQAYRDVMRLLPNGNVGIGTTAPAQKLDVVGNIQSSANIAVDYGNANAGTVANSLRFGPTNSGEAIGSKRTAGGNQFGLDFYTTSTNRMTITSPGNVGIGTTTPTALLDVNGSTRLRGLTTPGLVQTDASGNLSSATAASLDPTTASNGLTKVGSDFRLGGTLAAATTIAQGGNAFSLTGGSVGIGTTAPQAQLHLYNGTTYTPLFQPGVVANGTAGYGELMFGNGGVTKAAAIQVIDDGNFGGGLYFNVHNTTGGDNWPTGAQNAMTLRPNGNVGIGTISPTATLDVAGSARIQGLTTAGVVTTDVLGNLSSATAASLDPTTASNGLTKVGSDFRLGGTLTGATTIAQGGFGLGLTGGKVGIGTATPQNLLDLGSSIGATPTDVAAKKLAVYQNATGSDFYGFGITSGLMHIYAQTTATAGPSMTFDGLGRVGIGTTAPIQKLEVEAGGIRASGNGAFTAVSVTNQGAHLQWNRTGSEGETWLINHIGLGGANAGIRFAGITTSTGTVPTEWARFLNNGNFGIGTTAPTALLDVNGSTRLRGLTTPGLVQTDASGNLSSATAASLDPTTASNGLTKVGSDFRLGGTLAAATTVAQGTNFFALTGAGQIGLGTAAATGIGAHVTVQAAAITEPGLQVGLSGASAAIAFKTEHNGSNFIVRPVSAGGTSTAIENTGGGALAINPTIGNVGIGTTAPTQKLDVRGNLRLGVDGGAVTGTGNAIEFVGPGVNTDPVGLYRVNTASDASELRVVVGDNSDVNDRFSVGRTSGAAEGGIPTGTFTPTFTVRADGNVGIGTTAPAEKLDVTGNIQSSTNIAVDYNNANAGNVANTLRFGPTTSGEAIGSKRTATGNQFGLDFYTSSTNRMTITNAGNVGIGTTTPNQRLDVANGSLRVGTFAPFAGVAATDQGAHLQWNRSGGDGETWLINHIGGGTANAGIRFGGITTGTGTVPTEWARFNNAGNFGIGTTAPNYKLEVQGDINAIGAVRSNGTALTSDRRLKRNITPSAYGLATVLNLQPVQYEKKATIQSTVYDRHEIGFIAQDLQKLLPTLVSEGRDADKTLAVSYTELIPVLTKAIQEQQAQIEALKSQNAVLQTKTAQADADHASLLTLQAQMARLLGETAPADAQARK